MIFGTVGHQSPVSFLFGFRAAVCAKRGVLSPSCCGVAAKNTEKRKEIKSCWEEDGLNAVLTATTVKEQPRIITSSLAVLLSQNRGGRTSVRASAVQLVDATEEEVIMSRRIRAPTREPG